MPDQYIKFPRKQSIEYFEQVLNRHDRVLSWNKLSNSYYEIQREELPSIRVFVSDYYALSISDFFEITNEYDIDCLITISTWNKVTQDAYELGKSNGVGVFTMNEFMGALNCARPCTYVRPIDREDNDRPGFEFGRIS